MTVVLEDAAEDMESAGGSVNRENIDDYFVESLLSDLGRRPSAFRSSAYSLEGDSRLRTDAPEGIFGL